MYNRQSQEIKAIKAIEEPTAHPVNQAGNPTADPVS
jgi:hypothetical protein